MDFEAYQFYRANGIKYYWGCGTALSCVFLAAGLMYIVVEYYTQSHLNTEDYESAAQGLRKVRRFKKRTVWFRHLAKFLLKSMHVMTWGTLKSDSKTLSWDWRTKEDQEQIANLVPRNPPGQGRRPSSNVSNPSDSGDEGHSPSASLSDRDTSSEMHTLTSLVQAQIEPHSQL